jgi:DUF2934 family protein
MAKRSTASRTRTADTNTDTNTNTVPFPERRQKVATEHADDSITPSALDASSSETRSDSMSSEPSEEAIRLRAYQRYLDRGGHDGKDFDDWLHAEQELKKGGKT